MIRSRRGLEAKKFLKSLRVRETSHQSSVARDKLILAWIWLLFTGHRALSPCSEFLVRRCGMDLSIARNPVIMIRSRRGLEAKKFLKSLRERKTSHHTPSVKGKLLFFHTSDFSHLSVKTVCLVMREVHLAP
jgi:hypothetical protein